MQAYLLSLRVKIVEDQSLGGVSNDLNPSSDGDLLSKGGREGKKESELELPLPSSCLLLLPPSLNLES